MTFYTFFIYISQSEKLELIEEKMILCCCRGDYIINLMSWEVI